MESKAQTIPRCDMSENQKNLTPRMSRSVAWRRTCNDAVFWRQCQALNATIYILRETGPTGFLLKEEGEAKPVKVFLGDPHSCTCSTFMKDRDLCKHICWLILKKFRVAQNNPVTWQLGLVEREINDILFGATVKQRKTPVRRWATSGPPGTTGYTADGRPTIQQREIGDDDCCPICQDELLQKHQPVTYCKFGCGNSIHIKCMKIWADHQKTSGEKTIKCPFCREDFGPIELLKQESRNAMGVPAGGRMDRHLNTKCQSCHMTPIEGKCYRCTACSDFHLCQSCFNTSIHTSHPFEYRHKRNQRWRPAQRTYGAVLPEAVANDLLNREFTESDYELLTQLDSNANQQQSDIPEAVVNKFPIEKVRERGALLAPGIQCRICLRGYEVNQFVRKLPTCKHKFHKDCIDNWLLHSHPTCPVDGQVVWDPVTAQLEAEEQAQRNSERSSAASKTTAPSGIRGNDVSELSIPGVGLVRVDNTPVERSLKGRKVAQKGRLQGRVTEEPSADTLRASFTLNGMSVGSNGGDGAENVSATAGSSMPGGRLLGRLQHRKSSLNQRLQELSTQSDEQQSTEDADIQSQSSEHFADSRASLTGSHTSLSSIRSTRLANGIILAEAQDSGPEGGSSRGHSGGSRVGLPPRAPRLSEHERHLRRGPPNQEAGQSGSENDQEGNQLIERLQLFTDLYLGNSPSAPSDHNGRQPRVLRRQISNPTAVQQRKRENEIRRRRTNEFGLEGTSAYKNLTLRDIIH
ncbi:E3 ubiquitin-protein ligase ZSWIM2-like isoform X2 [Ostrea edulis]|uniref:E3 ubiquitin-protein ligase ZSWIM2-like isoform X2 n=1 Tax=Ostrea edulis TaxID=37623 RepID=UPI0020944297|nr:E3 ubiquitin-protein ligase ZSWIM2-like isoform X2 [Ostrea edulis]